MRISCSLTQLVFVKMGMIYKRVQLALHCKGKKLFEFILTPLSLLLVIKPSIQLIPRLIKLIMTV